MKQAEAQQGLSVTEGEVVAQASVVVFGSLTVVEGDVVGGDKTDIHTGNLKAMAGGIINVANEIHQSFASPDPAEEERKRQSRVRLRYLERLSRTCQSLPLAALGGEEGADEDITLDQVYIDLDTTTRVPVEDEEKAKKRRQRDGVYGVVEGETRLVSALEAAAAEKRLVLLGDPGAGKSTFVRRLAAWLAAVEVRTSQTSARFRAWLAAGVHRVARPGAVPDSD